MHCPEADADAGVPTAGIVGASVLVTDTLLSVDGVDALVRGAG